MKIVFDKLEDSEAEIIKSAFSKHEVIILDAPLTEDNCAKAKDAEILSVFISSEITESILSKMPNLKFIATRSTGYNRIDLSSATARGIAVSNVPNYGSRTVAEFAFALIFALSRKAYSAYDRLRTNGSTDVKDFEGFNLAGKTLGIIGTGNIGKNSARIANGLGMKILAFDVYPDEEFAKEASCEYTELEKLVTKSDIITIHVPLLSTTHHLINAKLLSLFKQDSYLINTARGGIIDTHALVSSLKNGKLAGAGLDVLEGERELLDETSLLLEDDNDIEKFRLLVADHSLVDMPNVIVTPHIAFNTREAKREILETTIENIKSYIAGATKNTVS